jgi:uncharacterized protein
VKNSSYNPNYDNNYGGNYEGYEEREAHQIAAAAAASERITFIRRTYGHLAGAILAFVALEMLFFLITSPEWRMNLLAQFASNPMYMLLVLGGFIGFGFLGNYWANNATSRGMQYAGLGLYVILEAVIFLPLLIYAADFMAVTAPNLIGEAAIMTAIVFGGLTFGVFVTKQDFSFLGGFLWIAGMLALGIIVCAIIFGFSLGIWFSVAMIALASCYILYYTSNVLHHYRTDQYVAASLALFAAVAMLFFYILRLLMARGE